MIGTVALVRRIAAVGAWPGSAWRCPSWPSRSCSSCSCSRRWAPTSAATRTGSRIAGVTIQPSEIIKVGLVLTGALDPLGQAQAPALVQPRARALPRAPRCCQHRRRGARPRPRHGAHPRGDRRRSALRRRHPAALVLRSPESRSPPPRSRSCSRARTACRASTSGSGRDTNEFGAACQSIHGRYALADGGWFGRRPGCQPREVVPGCSEPHNDFIFAIIGEELGLPGTIAILLLFAVLALGLLPPGHPHRATTSCGSRRPAS